MQKIHAFSYREYFFHTLCFTHKPFQSPIVIISEAGNNAGETIKN